VVERWLKNIGEEVKENELKNSKELGKILKSYVVKT